MTRWQDKPFIYEINTAVWLTDLSHRFGQPITLDNIPNDVIDELSDLNIDVIWLMGVWNRSEAVRESALNYMHEYRPVLPDLTEDDVIGSAYAIGGYQVDKRLGGREGLAKFRRQISHRGMLLILDFVPNHVATDHPIIQARPTCMVLGNEQQHQDNPGVFFPTENKDGETIYVGHGRDPHFPGWIDTAQFNAFSKDYRAAAKNTLLDIASQCDGVRCDMAMLMVNDIFTNTWGRFLANAKPPKTDFWHEIIPAVKAQYKDFKFIAEVYWSMEYQMLQQGFDMTYDKTLYDRILQSDVSHLRDHLLAPLNYQTRQLRFIENHDEPRAADTIGFEKGRAAATLIATLPGAVLLHDGQFTGRRIKLPVQINRQPEEPNNRALGHFYKRLLAETRDPIYQDGIWRLLDLKPAGEGMETHHHLIAYGWQRGDQFRLIVVNMTHLWSQGIINLGEWVNIFKDRWVLHDALTNTYRFHFHDDDIMADEGLYVDLEPFQSMILRFGVTGNPGRSR